MRKIIVLFVSSLILFFGSGCFSNSGKSSTEFRQNLEKSSGTGARIEQQQISRIKYHNLWNTARFMVVEGSFEGSSKKYPVILDTGASQALFIKSRTSGICAFPQVPSGKMLMAILSGIAQYRHYISAISVLWIGLPFIFSRRTTSIC